MVCGSAIYGVGKTATTVASELVAQGKRVASARTSANPFGARRSMAAERSMP
jgi:hypothetical protein